MLDTNINFDELYKYEQEQYLNEKEKLYKEIKPRRLMKKESNEIIEKNMKLLEEILGNNDEDN